MKSGYKIFWTNNALNELEKTIEYLRENWTAKDISNFALKLEDTIALISRNPNLFPKSGIKRNVYRAIVAKHNTLFYRIEKDSVQILSLFSHRQSRKKIKL
jgi:plasmid stabilization system protein ParE